MQSTPYQAQFLAYELIRRRASDSPEKLAGVMAGAQVDLNPHQVDAALFAFRSPLSKGALLADEVGLGKTIEAGLVLSQKWAERQRRILVITPSNLRKQWHQELQEKFFLPCEILESRSYNAALKNNADPFGNNDHVIICSYQFARARADDVRAVPWDLVVIDEAHRLRNVYKKSNIIANALKEALTAAPKLLLTATPLQNSLLELYGLVSFIDEHIFADVQSFREQFTNLNGEAAFQLLKERLRPVCHRTLRRQVATHIFSTKRLALLQEFTPGEEEDQLYGMISEYLRRDSLQALPPGQRALITLVLRKLLASSTFAIAGALHSMSRRLKKQLSEQQMQTWQDELEEDYEALDETAEEWNEETSAKVLLEADLSAMESEIAELDAFASLATSIEHNAKGQALLQALEVAFRQTAELGAPQKAVIFTESRRTQDYLLRLLGESTFGDGLVLFNGSNNDPRSREIYANWLARHQNTDRVTGSKTADMRSALVDYFRDEGRIMIATEAINLQFCSLVVNYDLPWNPQRIEQRIGRCHRYGQKHDVVVVNFVNARNEADQRVMELLTEKFNLFNGVFGSSDEVLGAIESGVDFEKRIAEIYQRCRKHEEIQEAFDQLQRELSAEINETMTSTRRKLLENFDDEVREKLKIRDQATKTYLNHFERQLMALTRHELNSHATFSGETSFDLLSNPFPQPLPLGKYELPRQSGEAHLYRLEHPLAQAIIERAKDRELPPAEIHFDYARHDGKISALEPYLGQSGVLSLSLFTVESLGQTEDHLLIAARTDSGQTLEPEAARRLFSLPANVADAPKSTFDAAPLQQIAKQQQDEIMRDISQRNAQYFEAEAIKLDGWADNLKQGLEREIKNIDRQIKETRRAASAALSLEEKLEGQKEMRALEKLRNEKRRNLYNEQDQVEERRDELIERISGSLEQRFEGKVLFTLHWKLI